MSQSEQEWSQRANPIPFVGVLVAVLVFVVALGAAALVFALATNDQTPSAGATVNVTVKEYSVTAPPTALSGDVTFVVTNAGTMPHELLVVLSNALPGQIPITDGGDPPVPVSSGANKISEDGSVGETGGDPLEPGETRTFTVTDLAAGKYQLLCNIAGHYTNGMWSAFTVK
jgi:uncharacterized cupredoxin-like copper-binding protein